MQPSKKSPEMEKFLSEFQSYMFDGRTRQDCIPKALCVTCGSKAETFKDSLSRKEYSISGMCQQCQDNLFDPEYLG